MAKVETHLKSKTLTISPKPGASLSPRVLWEAVEKGDDLPLKLVGPSGTFTSKPTL